MREHVFVHDAKTHTHALALLEQGLSDADIAARTGVARRTVNGWRRDPPERRNRAVIVSDWRPREPAMYAYVLGLYLGDGWLHVRSPRSAMLTIVCDLLYPGVIAEAEAALAHVFRGARVRWNRRPQRCVAIELCSPELLGAFPQHGAGKKHDRRIELADWQREITSQHPREFLRGLIHSDGCRTVNTFKTKLPSGRVAEYSYPRYFFSNLSPDIRAIFCEHADLLGIRWTQSNHRNISVSHRKSVALLDSFVGPKT